MRRAGGLRRQTTHLKGQVLFLLQTSGRHTCSMHEMWRVEWEVYVLRAQRVHDELIQCLSESGLASGETGCETKR